MSGRVCASVVQLRVVVRVLLPGWSVCGLDVDYRIVSYRILRSGRGGREGEREGVSEPLLRCGGSARENWLWEFGTMILLGRTVMGAFLPHYVLHVP